MRNEIEAGFFHNNERENERMLKSEGSEDESAMRGKLEKDEEVKMTSLSFFWQI
jgi:hypothetical protein